MLEKLYQKENNLFQSPEWLSFQLSLGRKTVNFPKNDCNGILVELPLNKKFIWIQKAPQKIDLKEINKIGKSEKAVFVRIEPKEKPKIGRKVETSSLLSGQKSPEATSILDIRKSEEDLLAQMKPKTRYNIKLAEKKGVKIRISQEIKDIDILYNLLKETSAKNKGFSHFPKKYYETMMKELGHKGMLRIFWAEYEGEPLAAILVSVYGKTATYLHGGSTEKFKNLMAPYLCQWVAVKKVKELGCELYDFWGTAKTDDESDPWAGITKFKKGFGGEQIIFPGAYDYPVNNFWYNLLTIASKIRKVF